MVPSGAMAGAEFAGTRWTPQINDLGTASGLGGHLKPGSSGLQPQTQRNPRDTSAQE